MNDNLRHDTRSTAARYISKEIPSGSTIGLFGRETELWRFPKIDSDLIVMIAMEKPEYLITSSFKAIPEDAMGESKQALVSDGDHYKLVAEFTPKWDLDIEFVSPLIRIYRR